jgi:ABC-type branched-subunit amino acid transport system ATPase component/MFS family permease
VAERARVAARPPVPSARERGDAARPLVDTRAPSGKTEDRIASLSRVGDMFRSLKPREIAAGHSVLPLVVLTVLAALTQWDLVAFQVVLPFIRTDMGFDFTFLLTLQSAILIVAVAAAPFAGFLADRIKRLRMIRAGGLVQVVSALGAAAAPTPGLLIAARAAGGLGPGLQQPAAYPLLADYYPPSSRARSFSFIQIGTLLGSSIGLGAVIFGVFYGNLSWRTFLAITGILGAAVTALTFVLREPERGKLEREELAQGVDGAEAAEDVVQKPASFTEAWRTAASIGTLRRIWYATPFLTVAQVGLQSYLYFVMRAKVDRLIASGGHQPGGSILQSKLALPTFIAVPAAVGVLALAFSAPIGERMLARRPAAIMVAIGSIMAVNALAILFLLLAPWILPAILVLWVAGAAANLILPAQYILLSRLVPVRIRAQGLQSIAWWQLGGYVLLPIIGSIGDAYGVNAGALLMIPIYLAGAALMATAGVNVERDIRAATAATLADDESRAARQRGQAKLVVCRDVDVTYGGTQVLFNVDLDIEDGETVALLGTNGAGKSTLLRAIAGLQAPSNGAIFMDGEDVTHRSAHLNARAGVVFVPGGRAVFPLLTVEENLRTAAWMLRAEPEFVAGKVEEVLELFPILRERLQERAGNMSGGEQQMLALGQAFVMRPRLLMIDELSLGLAPAIVERLLEVVRRIGEQGTTIVLVEQSVNVALTVARRAVFMDKGRVVFDGPTGELLERPDIVRSVFLGGTGATAVTAGPKPALARSVNAEGEDAVAAALEVAGVAVSFGGVSALRGVSLSVAPSEVLGVIGPNGAGKTTLFDIVSGFVLPDEGAVSVAGVDVTAMAPDARARLGLARSFQNARLFPSLTVREAIATALERHLSSRSTALAAAWAGPARKSERRARRRVAQLVELLSLGAYADKFVGELSTGTRRMVELACLTAAEPAVLLLDEPSSGLAQAEVEALGPVVQRLARELGAGVVMIEHDLPLVAAASDRMLALELGQVLVEGEPDEVVTHPKVVASYLSASDSVIERSGPIAQALRAVARS